MKRIALLGATGSIGTNTIAVLKRYPDLFELVAISGHSNEQRLLQIARDFKVQAVAFTGDQTFPEGNYRLYTGSGGLVEMCQQEEYDILLVATAGLAGALPTIKALQRGKRVALANKETLVSFGPLVKKALSRSGELIPVDSEHSALFQLLHATKKQAVELVITSSGGAFRGMKLHQLQSVGPEDALKHPTWSMGAKITVDSATLMNKVLEVIEAHFLFDFPPENISVVVHPTSTVHGLVRTVDNMLLAHMGVPDMKAPIAFALSYPDRIDPGVPQLRLPGLRLEFHEPDTQTFRLLPLAWEALRAGGTSPGVLNAANEVAVHGFLNRQIGFLDIFKVVEEVFSQHISQPINEIEDVLEADAWARSKANQIMRGLG